MIVAQMTTTQLTAEQARLIAEDFIIDQIGDQVMAGEPWLISSALSSAWVTPLILTASAYGPVGAIGVLVVDGITGQVIASTPIEVLEENTDRLLEGRESELETIFQCAGAKHCW